MVILKSSLFIILLFFAACQKEHAKFDVQRLVPEIKFEPIILNTSFDCSHKYSLSNVPRDSSGKVDVLSLLLRMKKFKHLDLYDLSISNYSWATFVNDTCSQKDNSVYLKCKRRLEKKFVCLRNDFIDSRFWLITERLKTQNPFIIPIAPLGIVVIDEEGRFAYHYKENIVNNYEKKEQVRDGELEKQALTIYSYGGMYSLVKKEIEKNPKMINEVPEFFGLNCRSPLQCAKQMCQKDVVNLLLQAGAKEEGGYKNMSHCP